MEKASSTNTRCEKFLEEIMAELSDPLHRRLVSAYRGDSPVQSMEAELAAVLLEVVKRED